MVYRIYVEKKPGFDGEAQSLRNELVSLLGIKELNGLRLLNRYDVEGIDEALFEQCVPTVFSEPPVDNTYAELPVSDGVSFAVEYLPGQFDQRADSASECIQLISQGERPTVRSAKVYALEGELSEADVEAIKHYVINPVEAREASLDVKTTLKTQVPTPGKVETIAGFNEMDAAAGQKFIDERGLAMDLADLEFCQKYFSEEGREPTITEIKVIDTYWSDHCRHTTFGTQLDDVQIDDAAVQAAFDKYLEMRHELGRDAKPVCLMDMGTIGARSAATAACRIWWPPRTPKCAGPSCRPHKPRWIASSKPKHAATPCRRAWPPKRPTVKPKPRSMHVKSSALLLAALASTLALCGCSTNPPSASALQSCPRPPAGLLQRMPPLPAIPTSLAGSTVPDTSTTPAAADSTR